MAWSDKSQPHRLILTKQFPLGSEKVELFRPGMLAANRLWNSCVWHSRETYRAEGHWPSEKELKSNFKGFAAWKELHSQSAQAVVEEYFEAVSGYRKHRRNGHEEINPPGFKPKDNLRTVTWKKQGFAVEGDTLALKLSRKKKPIRIPLPKKWDIVALPNGALAKGVPAGVKAKAVIRRRRVENLILHVTFDFGVMLVRAWGLSSAYDYNSAILARTVSDGTQDLFVCRELLSLVQYRNKILADFQEKMSRCHRGSCRWRKLEAKKLEKLQRLDRRIRQMEHALTKTLARLDANEDVAVAVMGDLKGLRYSSRTGIKGKKANQKINQMAYNRLQGEQRHKNLIRGIESISKSEADTSSTCFACGSRNPAWRRKRGLWVCGYCGVTMQADLNGSCNLLKRHLLGDCVGKKLPFPLKSPRVWVWNKRFNRFVQVSSRAA